MIFKVNGHRLKIFLKLDNLNEEIDVISLIDFNALHLLKETNPAFPRTP
jgi:hypothetical protein